MFKKKNLPEVYSEQELDILETHIAKYFGECNCVFHELVSPDIHADICIIEPTKERNHYTLVTMGMGAHRMNVPKELRKEKLDRAEIIVTLPPDWEIQNNDERWYWPLRWLKILARLPGEQDTWLGWGHTVPNGEPFADNTELNGVMLTMPYFFGNEAAVCAMPDGSAINFYQIMPLYENEMNYKRSSSAEALEELFPDDYDMVVNVNRPNTISTKNWFMKAHEMKELFHWDEPEGCFATDRILVDGCKVGYMYREEPDDDSENDLDSGWRFTAGDESDEYMDDSKNSGFYALNTIANNDSEIIPFLTAPYGSFFYRDENGVLKPDDYEEK